jgi:hypothetical protein
MKKSVKKLVLHRETIRALSSGTLSHAGGAGPETTQPTNLPYEQATDCECGGEYLPTACVLGSCSCGGTG